MNRFVQRLDKAKEVIDNADYIIIGAGAGLSTAAGIDYGFDRFSKYFQDFIDKYHFEDLYTSGFYPFETQEEKWAYWARHIQVNRYDVGKTVLYQKLLNLVKDKDYFVLTTNVEHQFWINEFEDERKTDINILMDSTNKPKTKLNDIYNIKNYINNDTILLITGSLHFASYIKNVKNLF